MVTSSSQVLHCTESFKSQRETVGDFHPMVIFTLGNLAFVHTKKRDYEKALKVRMNLVGRKKIAFLNS
jgi:hypothetical protein